MNVNPGPDIVDIEFQEVKDNKAAPGDSAGNVNTPPVSERNAEHVVVAPADEVKKKEGEQNQRVDFLKSNITQGFFKAQTSEKTDPALREQAAEKTEETPPNTYRSKTEEKIYNKENYPSPEDLKDVASLVLDFFDTGMSMVCGAIAQEKQTEQFSVPPARREKLVTLFSEILAKHQVKMSLEMLFFVLIVLIYSKPVAKALEIKRKKNTNVEPGIRVDKSETTVENNREQNGNQRFTEDDYLRATGKKTGKP